MRALGTYVVVCRRPIPSDIKSKGGVILTSKSFDEDYFEAVIMSVGNEAEELKLNQGDYVLVENTTNKFKLGNTKAGEVLAVNSFDIICVVEEEDEFND